ncbi:prepilin-type N-terminal cleavage/methylation domain-containing protein [Patescibacteria group bacterium]|nr:prepilin-type N-terminal cleavage/methylation domain-containing protein [Patescibacteria group bacterium]MBU4466883.1 prepilin-type N-terminal cleavage/methylation domain-containing protein [Patescibacteria group bacterium]
MNFKNKGFTLIELMVAMTLFVVIVGAIGTIFITSLQSQRRSIAFQNVFNQTSYLMEYMSRSLRMAKTETAALTCLSAENKNYELTRSNKGIKFINSQNVCQEFYFDTVSKRLKEAKGGAQEQFLTSENSQVTAFNIAVVDGAGLQPKITFLISIKRIGSKAELNSPMEFQTTLSQRRLNVQ